MIFHELYVANESKNLKTFKTYLKKIKDVLSRRNISTSLSAYSDKDKADIQDCIKNMIKAIVGEFNFDKYSNIKLFFSDQFVFETVTGYCDELINYNSLSDAQITDFVSIKEGRYKFKTGTTCYTEISLSVAVFKIFSLEEIMACFLHEIGHSFEVPIRLFNYRIAVLKSISKYIPIISNTYNEKNTPMLVKLMADIYMDFDDRNKFLIPNNRNNETFADEFAVSYGYGKYLASSLLKMEKEDIKYMNTCSILDNLFTDLGEIVFGTAHPEDIDRIEHGIMLLKKVYNDPNIPPKYKKSIKNTINDMDRLVKDTFARDPNDSIYVALKKALALYMYKEPDEITEKDWNDITINQMKNVDYIGKKIL